MQDEENENEEVVYDSIKKLLTTATLVTAREIEADTNLNYMTVLKYINILEAKGRIVIEEKPTLKAIVKVLP